MNTRSENLVYILFDEDMHVSAYGNLKTLLESVDGYDKNTYLAVGSALRNGRRKVRFTTPVGKYTVARIPVLRAPYKRA